MKYALLACSIAVVVPITLAAQAQPRARSAASSVVVTVQVTDQSGNPLPDVRVGMTGAVDRSGTTSPQGQVDFKTIGAGTYRLRFEHTGFITLEREVVVRTGQPVNVSVALNAAPASPPPVAPAPPPAPQTAPTGTFEARTVSITDFLEKNYIKSEPVKTSLLGCAQDGTARLLQVRDPLTNQLHGDADEFLYVVAGDGTIRIGERDTTADAGSFALVPRGVPHTLRRQGRNPLIVLSVMAGQGCEK